MNNHSSRAGEYGIEFADSFIRNNKAEDLEPKGAFFYHQGVFLSGIEGIYEITSDKKYDQYIHDYLDMFICDNSYISKYKRITSLDARQAANLAYRIYLETKDERYFECIRYCTETLKEYPKNSLGGLYHMPETKNQMWLDSLYMAGPLCVKYASLTGDTYFYDLPVRQALIMQEKMTDKKSGLMFHAWDESKKAEWADKETGLSAIIWGRALGWVVVALPQIISFLPSSYPGRDQLISMERNLIKNIVKYQDKKSGMWFQVTDCPNRKGNWVETSCTCLFVKGIASSVNAGIIDEEYIQYAKDGFDGVINNSYDRAGGKTVIKGICVGTGVDEGTFEHYISRPTTENDLHGGGAFLMMCSEMEKYNRREKR